MATNATFLPLARSASQHVIDSSNGDVKALAYYRAVVVLYASTTRLQDWVPAHLLHWRKLAS